MIYGSVCSGIEAASVAWHPLGWRASFLSEIEPFPRAVLSHHYPDVPLHGDFTTIQASDYEPIDLLVGGTPCQAFSITGLRGGLADKRGNLALEYLRLADRLRPRWILWENVFGVLSSGDGRDFGSLLGALGELGYGFAYRVLNARYFAHAQQRERVFLVGYLGDWRRATSVLFEPTSLRGDFETRIEARSVSGRIFPCLTRRGSGSLREEEGYVVEACGGIRHLTPIECERLQGFNDNYTLVDYRGKNSADGPRYRALGNSMPVNVMAWIGRRIAIQDAA